MPKQYQAGFQNYFETEAEAGALPRDRNAPQVAPLGLYAEQVNNSAFTAPRVENFNSWEYRLRPSVIHSGEAQLVEPHLMRDSNNSDDVLTPPMQMRWSPIEIPSEPTDVIASITTVMFNSVSAIHLYAANASMENTFFYNSDGEWLFVLQEGRLKFKTEMGIIEAAPGEIVVIPRGIRYQIELLDKQTRGYICESQAAHFFLPERGPIGANGLAEERHFLAPTAYYEDKAGDFELYTKFQGHLWKMPIKHSPLDVVAWHGNLYPYKYDLKLFCPVNAVLKDHTDPSVFTVLSAPSPVPGTANIDFVIFPERWVVSEDTFRPPYYHRNTMSEFMGLIIGEYDAKKAGFVPGAASLHNCMTAHGPDANTYKLASTAQLKPTRYKDTLAFMFESRESYRVTKFALEHSARQKNYIKCWSGLESRFKKQT